MNKTIAIVLIIVFLICIVVVSVGYLTIKGFTFITNNVQIKNITSKSVYYKLKNAIYKLDSGNFAQIKISLGDYVYSGYERNDLFMIYRFESINIKEIYIFQDTIQDNETSFYLNLINLSGKDISVWAVGKKNVENIPDVGVGGKSIIPVYTNEILKFAQRGMSIDDAPYIFVVQDSWVNELYITPTGITTSTVK